MTDTPHAAEIEAPDDDEAQGIDAPTLDDDEGDDEGRESPDDEEEGAQPDAPPVEPAAPGLTDKQIEARFKALAKENDRHAAAVGRVLEEDANDLLQCPLCSGFIAGWLLNAPIADEPRAATLGLLGLLDVTELPQASYLTRCDTCEGRGEVRTGSARPGYEAANCQVCEGRGYTRSGASVTLNGGMAPDYLAPHADVQPPPPDDDPRIVELKAAGFTVIPPYVPATA